jgi:hypothetical protein
VDYYPELAHDAFSPPGLLLIPARAHADAIASETYDGLVARLAASAPTVTFETPPASAFWLRLDGFKDLSREVQRRRDEAFDGAIGRLEAALKSERRHKEK